MDFISKRPVSYMTEWRLMLCFSFYDTLLLYSRFAYYRVTSLKSVSNSLIIPDVFPDPKLILAQSKLVFKTNYTFIKLISEHRRPVPKCSRHFNSMRAPKARAIFIYIYIFFWNIKKMSNKYYNEILWYFPWFIVKFSDLSLIFSKKKYFPWFENGT